MHCTIEVTDELRRLAAARRRRRSFPEVASPSNFDVTSAAEVQGPECDRVMRPVRLRRDGARPLSFTGAPLLHFFGGVTEEGNRQGIGARPDCEVSLYIDEAGRTIVSGRIDNPSLPRSMCLHFAMKVSRTEEISEAMLAFKIEDPLCTNVLEDHGIRNACEMGAVAAIAAEKVRSNALSYLRSQS